MRVQRLDMHSLSSVNAETDNRPVVTVEKLAEAPAVSSKPEGICFNDMWLILCRNVFNFGCFHRVLESKSDTNREQSGRAHDDNVTDDDNVLNEQTKSREYK